MKLSDKQITSAYEILSEGRISQILFLKDIADSDDDYKLAQFIQRDILIILNKHADEKTDLVIDLSALSKNHRISRKARKVYLEMLNYPQCGRLAFVGPNIFLKVMIVFLIKAGGVEARAKMFNNRNEAIAWLKKQS
jgi:hypothetical protein